MLPWAWQIKAFSGSYNVVENSYGIVYTAGQEDRLRRCEGGGAEAALLMYWRYILCGQGSHGPLTFVRFDVVSISQLLANLLCCGPTLV